MAAFDLTDLGATPDHLARLGSDDLLALETHFDQRATIQTKRGQQYMAAQEAVRAALTSRGVRTRFVKHDDLPAHLARRTEHHMFELFDRDGNPAYMTSLTTEAARVLRDQLIAANLG